MTQKLDKILDTVMSTQIKVAKIEEHLKSINGRVGKTENNVELNREKILQNKALIMKTSGIVSVIVSLIIGISLFLLKT